MSLFESQFVGSNDDKPGKLFEFLDLIKREVISSTNLYSLSMANKIGGSADQIDALFRKIKQKDD
jgi:hypothetical protein